MYVKSKSTVSQLVSESVTRSPIELSAGQLKTKILVVDILQSNATAETKAELYLGPRTEDELSDEFLNAAKWQDHEAEQVFFKRLLLLEFSQW